MRVRRCSIVMFEPRETVEFSLDSLLVGGDGLEERIEWGAIAPHLGTIVKVGAAQRELLGKISPSKWMDTDAFVAEACILESLVEAGLVFYETDQESQAALRDIALRAVHWHPLAAVLHSFTRWDGVDSVKNARDSNTETAADMRRVLGVPPAEVARLSDDSDAIALAVMPDTDFDQLLRLRVTCRNYAAERALPLPLLTRMLQRVFAENGRLQVGEDLVFLKKNVPSGGGLHPIEAYVIVQNVEGLPSGIYHYRADLHALEPLPHAPPVDREFVMEALGQQHWFADAHVLVALVPRFARTFWKYREHAKSYRVVAMEAGHLSQLLYLSATDLGLGAFVTGAINEGCLERAFQLEPVTQGTLAICGFGWRASRMVTTEFDPAGVVWTLPEATSVSVAAHGHEGQDAPHVRLKRQRAPG